MSREKTAFAALPVAPDARGSPVRAMMRRPDSRPWPSRRGVPSATGSQRVSSRVIRTLSRRSRSGGLQGLETDKSCGGRG